MRQLRGLLLLGAAVALLLAPGAGAAGAGGATAVRIVEAGDGPFPKRTYLLTLPTKVRLGAGDVAIRENGEPVHAPTITAAYAAESNQFGVVLAIDASTSMRGEPLAKAMDAARAFSRRTDAYQQLAAIAFNDDTQVLLPFTADRARVRSALSVTPQVAYYTRMYEALDRAIRMIERAGIRNASIVLLSDGQELGSKGTLEGAVERAQKSGVRIFGIGLDSRFFDSRPLRTLASSTGGSYLQASSPSELTAIFDLLGAQLSNEYLVSYDSLAGPGEKIKVQVNVKGVDGVASAGYVTPELDDPERTLAAPYDPSFATSFWLSPLTMLAIGLLCAVLVTFLVLAFVQPSSKDLLRRMSAFVSIAKLQEGGGEVSLPDRPGVRGERRSIERARWWAQFVDDVELADVEISAERILLFTAIGTFVVAVMFFAVAGAPGMLVALAVPLISRALVNRRLRKKRRAFADQLPDNLEVIASALRAGHTLVGALSVVVEDAAEPSRTEFRRVVADEQLGIPLEDSIGSVVRRMDNQDLDQVALVAALQRQTGGSAAEVLDRVTDTVRERAELRRLISSLTAQGRLSRWILSFLPVFLLVAISLINPGYISPLFTEALGRMMLILAGVMIVIGSLVIRKIVDIKV
jgi:tight adherence protein B